MRVHEAPRWRRLRHELGTRGIEPADAALATLFEDNGGEFGVIVTRDGKSLYFHFRFGDEGDLRQQVDESTVEWGGVPPSTYERELSIGLAVLREEEGAQGHAPSGRADE